MATCSPLNSLILFTPQNPHLKYNQYQPIPGTAIEGHHHAPAEQVARGANVDVGEGEEAQARSCEKELRPYQATLLRGGRLWKSYTNNIK